MSYYVRSMWGPQEHLEGVGGFGERTLERKTIIKINQRFSMWAKYINFDNS